MVEIHLHNLGDNIAKKQDIKLSMSHWVVVGSQFQRELSIGIDGDVVSWRINNEGGKGGHGSKRIRYW